MTERAVSHIRMIPKEPLFEDEHLTLVWCVPGPVSMTEHEKNMAGNLLGLINSRLYDDELEPVTFTVSKDNPYRLFTGKMMVAVGSVSQDLRDFHTIAMSTRLEKRPFKPWVPHISGIQGAWREPGEVVEFRRAVLK